MMSIGDPFIADAGCGPAPPPSPISYLKGSQLSSVSCAVGFILCAFLSIPKSPTETMHTDVA